MERFKLWITMENAAFEAAPQAEVCRILRDVAERIESNGYWEGNIRDVNGNRVGQYGTGKV